MIKTVTTKSPHLCASITRGLQDRVEELTKQLHVSYSEALAEKTIVAAFYLAKESGQKHYIATGFSTTYFEERYNKAIGEKLAYEDGLRRARSFIENYVYTNDFLEAVDFNEDKLVKPGQ